MDALEQGFQLDDLRVDPQTGEVAGPGGRARLDRKVMDVLVYMARHAGHVVTREELHTALWPGAVVTDDAATRCFYELRRQLSRAGGHDRYRALLETLPKRGYRLNGTVAALAPAIADVAVEAQKRRFPAWTITATAAVVAILAGAWWVTRAVDTPVAGPAETVRHSIAVLPFLDMSEAKDQGYFSDGVTEEILNRLSQADNLRVISRTSSFSMRDESLDVPEIAARLDVDYLLEGSVRRSGQHIRITAQLIDASTNTHLWSKTYDRGVVDLFVVQDEIAVSVASALQVSLAGNDSAERPPASVDAYERFLQGQFHYNRRLAGDIERSVEYYKQAVKLDPAYARAWAALAGGYSILYAEVRPNDHSLRDLQGEAARKAVDLDPTLAVAQARLAQYYYRIQQGAKGDTHMQRAIDLDPDDPLVLGHVASEAAWRGDFEQAVRLWRRIVALDPLSPVSRGNLAYMLYANGQLDDALTELRRTLELNPGAADVINADIARILILQERYDDAIAVIQQLPTGKGRDYVIALMHRAPGHGTEADAALARLAGGKPKMLDVVRLAEAHVFRGMNEEGLDLLIDFHAELERGRSRNPRGQWYFSEEIRMSPLLKPLHDDPRWAVLTELPEDF